MSAHSDPKGEDSPAIRAKSVSPTSFLAALILAGAIIAQLFPEAFGGIGLSRIAQVVWEQVQGISVASDYNPANVPEDHACIALAHWLPEIVHLPGSSGYRNQARAHWSEQAQNALPSCVARPQNTTEVSHVVTVLKNLYELPFVAKASGNGGAGSNPVRFVVRSGGHSVEVGQSSINGGVLIDLAPLNFINLSDDTQSITIGPGARWGEVFEQLDKIDLAVAGGRNARVGVGGLVLGGGLSWISPQVGMVQDNILEYEVVLANGTIVTVSQKRYPDLWRALKGGSGNFGIVTSFKARTFPATKIWAGHVYYYNTRSITDKLLNAVHDFVKPTKFDPYAAGPILAFGTLKMLGYDITASCSHNFYSKPVAWPPVWESFKSIFYLWSTARTRTYASAAEELVGLAVYGKQVEQATLTIKTDIETLREIHNLYAQSWKSVRHVKGISWNLVIQPLTPAIIHHGSTNSLGLETRNASDPLLIISLPSSWTDASQNAFMQNVTRELITAMKEYATNHNTLDRYLYLNYAASWQDVFASYGEENHEFLRTVSRKYDRYGFWQHARAGGFKLGIDKPGPDAFAQHEPIMR